MYATLRKFRKKKPVNLEREVWVLDDDQMCCQLINKYLSDKGLKYRVFSSVSDFLDSLGKNKDVPKLFLLDYYLDDVLAIDIIGEIKKLEPDIHFIVMTGRGDEHLAVEIMKAGALDYIVKNDNFILHLPHAIGKAMHRIKISEQLKDSQQKLKFNLRRQKRLSSKVMRRKIALEHEQARAYKLLTNVLPEKIAGEILSSGTTKARYFPCVSVLFADVRDFSSMAKTFSPIELVQMLDDYFCDFDYIIGKLGLEKIKTIGDCYMCAGGIPVADHSNAAKVVLAGLQMQNRILEKLKNARKNDTRAFEMRIGIHTGEVVAGVVGHRKFSYDIWGDAANTASGIVHAGGVNRVNISRNTYDQVNAFFNCVSRGLFPLKGNKQVEMFFVDGLKPEFSADVKGIKPNSLFWEKVSEKEKCA